MGTPPGFSQEELTEREREAAQMMARSIRKAPGGCLRNILATIGILILAVAGLIAFDDFVAPWAWDFGGRPTLTGQWIGTFQLPQGQRGAVYLDLTHNANKDFYTSRVGKYRAPLEGTAQSCIGAVSVQTYVLSGGANESADDIALGFGAHKPTVAGYAFSEMSGVWSGDTLTLSGVFTKILNAQDSTLSASEPNQRQPTTIILHKGSLADFQGACQGLGT